MPTPLDDNLSSLHSHSPSAHLHRQQLPLHHDAQFPHAQELDNLSHTGQRHKNTSANFKVGRGEDIKHLLEEEEDSEGEDSEEDSSMGAKSRRPKSLEPSGSSFSLSGGENGHTTSSMNNNVEYRRKNASLESPTVTASLMARESFSLDEPVPRTPTINNHGFSQLPMQDKRNFGLLVLLYFLQGVPMGLAAGSVPFLLKGAHVSYSALGVFSLASYPYSLKLLWSPIVDAIWTPKLGRRKSWIMPIQMLSGLGMIWLGTQVKEMMVAAATDDGSGIWGFTWWWFFLVFMCATQDIAVDGWALTLLTPGNISYASTAQTVGLTAGQFMSYTVFLAFNSPDFANKYFRSTPLDEGVMTLGGYLTFWGWAYIAVTFGLAVLKKEEKTKNEDGIWDVYKVMWGVLKLKNIQTIIVIHLIAKIGFQANDGVTNLKLLDKGFSQEDLALTVLIDFPFEIGLGYYAGKWSTTYTPMRLWCWGFVGRLLAAVLAQITVMIFPAKGVDTWYLLVVIAEHIFSTFTNTVMFVAVSAFHARVADPVIGGTYMTLLATVSNLGGTFPRFFVLKLVDFFTVASCIPPPDTYRLSPTLKGPLVTGAFDCAMAAEKDRCIQGGGTCDISRDGYYVMNVVCVIIGVVTFWGYIKPAALKLQALPLRAWRIAEGAQ
ncbi:acetyl-coenzyme A transporter 1-domain-containing protein [Amylocarpus encephaloides]|uniref:Acetyl-coenzyme A transporter 1-domain-containing protein n=1 Tax=Amylocarpus encephaloides TaxID=45428 RepID=A0A9P7Y891_9HELO|nr:acetyl-coenzyme A transporter 1-domain-containing protein [Amylocarpus encephaloides]